jgi:hypothetical protein
MRRRSGCEFWGRISSPFGRHPARSESLSTIVPTAAHHCITAATKRTVFVASTMAGSLTSRANAWKHRQKVLIVVSRTRSVQRRTLSANGVTLSGSTWATLIRRRTCQNSKPTYYPRASAGSGRDCASATGCRRLRVISIRRTCLSCISAPLMKSISPREAPPIISRKTGRHISRWRKPLTAPCTAPTARVMPASITGASPISSCRSGPCR